MSTSGMRWHRAGLAALLCAAMAAQGCGATLQRGTAHPAPLTDADRAVLADYLQRLPLGTAVRVERVRGRTLRGTLMQASGDALVLQARTRVPEPPIQIPLADVLAVTPDTRGGNGLGTAIAAGAAVGAGAALAVFFILIAIYSS